MKRGCLITGILAILLSSPVFSQTEIRGVVLQDSLVRDGHALVLNGAGVRTKLVLKLYVGGLYLTEKSTDAASIIDADDPMMVQIHVISGLITSDKMIESVKDGFQKSTNGNTAPIQAEIGVLLETFKDDIDEGDVFELIYNPSSGVSVFKNGVLGATIEGLVFKKALFGIWLGQTPAHRGLRKAMLRGNDGL